jgi:cytochrome P450
VQLTARTALTDHELGGRTIRTGEQAITLIGAANRDPEAFRDPDTLDIVREQNHHLAFGGGAHFCLGAALARAEAQVALRALAGLPGLELAVDEPAWRNTTTLRGLRALPVRIG